MKIVQDNIVIYIGDSRIDYRSLMSEKAPILVNDFLIPYERMIKMEQTASDQITQVSKADAGAGFIEGKPEITQADAIYTLEKDLFLCVRTADCYPLVIFDKQKELVAVVHSGREGTRLNIVGKMLRIMQEKYLCQTEDIHVIIGPGISELHYEVDEKTFYEFVESTGIEQNYRSLDISKVLLHQISAEGVPVVNIQSIPICTYENEHYFSFRRDKTKNRQLSIIGIKS